MPVYIERLLEEAGESDFGLRALSVPAERVSRR